jgi:8-oxo-dGTP diphosphatase
MTTLPEATASDDAAAAKWWPLDALPKLAFDHDKILADAKIVLKID